MFLSSVTNTLFAPALTKDEDSPLMRVSPSSVLKSASWKTAAVWGGLHSFQIFGKWGLSPTLFSLVSFVGISLAEFIRAHQAAKEANLQDYIQSPRPSTETLRYLVENPLLIQELVEQRIDLTKTDPKGNTLLFAATDLYDLDVFVFDLLFTSVSWSLEETLNCLVHMTEFREELLEHVVEKKWIIGTNLNPSAQMALWMSVQSDKGVKLLKEMGCNPNIRDETGKTPFLKTAAGEYYGENALQQAQRLLAIGADPNALAIENGISKNALKLAREAQPRDPELIQFLESLTRK